jgi:hypothetical protein
MQVLSASGDGIECEEEEEEDVDVDADGIEYNESGAGMREESVSPVTGGDANRNC